MYAERVEVLHIAHRYAVVKTVTHHFIFNLFPTLQRLLHEHLRRERQRLLDKGNKLLLVVAESAAESAERISGAHDYGIAQIVGGLYGIGCGVDSLALDGLYIYLVELLHKQLTVLGFHDGTHRSSEHLHVVTVEHSALMQCDTAVERGLSAKRQQNAVGALLLDNLLHKVGRHGKEVYLVGKAVGCLYGSNVRIYQHGCYTLLLHCLKSLRT